MPILRCVASAFLPLTMLATGTASGQNYPEKSIRPLAVAGAGLRE